MADVIGYTITGSLNPSASPKGHLCRFCTRDLACQVLVDNRWFTDPGGVDMARYSYLQDLMRIWRNRDAAGMPEPITASSSLHGRECDQCSTALL